MKRATLASARDRATREPAAPDLEALRSQLCDVLQVAGIGYSTERGLDSWCLYTPAAVRRRRGEPRGILADR